MTVVSCRQIAPRVDDPGSSRAATVRAVHAAVDDGAEIIVLPELATSGYVFQSADGGCRRSDHTRR